jgi:DNA-binding CsgD family transcriptional regulator
VIHGSGQLVVGYHGCDRQTAESLLSGQLLELEPSDNPYDWLGPGVYFFQDDWRRALYFAQTSADNPKRQFTRRLIKDPYVIGAVMKLSFILDVSTQDGIDAFRTSYEALKTSGVPLKRNRKSQDDDTDVILRQLDRQVFKNLHQLYKDQGLPPLDAVRGAFPQGEEVAPTSAIFANSHVQIALREQSCILGYFRVPGLAANALAEKPALTPKQELVLQLLTDGRSNPEIAAELNVSEETVKGHVSAVLRNFGALNRTQAVVAAFRSGYRQLPQGAKA